MFDSLPQTFTNCLTGSDYKELIPEFFYQPEVLVMHNNLVLGTKQNGKRIGDVQLPAWSKGSAEEFVRINRKALESDYVSEHLHEWIDLIFGYKQRGEAAVQNYNVFYYLTYEGTVDIDAIQDEVQRRAIIAQIENFGQTPSQLFTKPHMKRQRREQVMRAFMYSPVTSSNTHTVLLRQQISQHASAPLVYLQLFPESNRIAAVSKLGMIYMIKFPFSSASAANSATATGVLDVLLRKRIPFPFSPQVRITEQNFAMFSRNKDVLMSCGHWDASVKCTKIPSASIVQSIWRHKDLISCMAMCEQDSVLVTGSHDTTVIIWETQLEPTDKSDDSLTAGAALGAAANMTCWIKMQPRHILYGHDDILTCLAVDADLDVVISGSRDGTCIVHTLRQGRYIRSIRHPCNGPIDLIALSHETGHMVMYSKADLQVHLFSINGKHVHSIDTCDVLHCLKIHDSKYVMYGGEKGIVWVRKLHNMKLVAKFDTESRSAVKSLAVSPDERFVFIGLANGAMCVCGTNKL
jgi:hypothetical protein